MYFEKYIETQLHTRVCIKIDTFNIFLTLRKLKQRPHITYFHYYNELNMIE